MVAPVLRTLSSIVSLINLDRPFVLLPRSQLVYDVQQADRPLMTRQKITTINFFLKSKSHQKQLGHPQQRLKSLEGPGKI